MISLMLACALTQDAQRILKAYEAARPSQAQLVMYKLDWAADLAEARARAAKEKRPIFFVATQQLEDAGSLFTGHC
jgi:hypothetical protein